MNNFNKTSKSMNFNTIESLINTGLADPSEFKNLKQVADKYTVLAPKHLTDLIIEKPSEDPIAKQIIPSPKELVIKKEENKDPIGDERFSPLKGLVHRYSDRALIKMNSSCAVYCRFCFRREVIGPHGHNMNDNEIKNALEYVQKHKEISEVILSGGDPFILKPEKIINFMEILNTIEHVKILRFHTRVPVAAPHLVTTDFIKALKKNKKTTFVAIHINHYRELSTKTIKVCKKLLKAGIILIGQTVLLKGVNNKAKTLKKLFKEMLEARIIPYYLHHPDLANGTGHFRVSIQEGQSLMRELRGEISGIAIPTYTLDIPGGYGKIPVGPEYISEKKSDFYELKDIAGRAHKYPSN